MLKSIEAAVFDLDGTLLDRRRSFERFVRDQWRRFAHRLQSVEQAHYVQAAIESDRDGYAPREELFASVLAPFDLPSELADDLLRDYRAGFPHACVLFPDAGATLSSLRTCGLKLGLITNGSVRMQSAKLNCLALASTFDVVLISGAEGIHKPDPAIFHRALDRLSTAAGRAVFVGDNPEVDVSGARRAGMKAIWRRDPTLSCVVEADAVIDELGELLPLLAAASRRGRRSSAAAAET
jgi:putative hydrolase of the HAD superfamily